MATGELSNASQFGDASSASKSSVLLVIGEPQSEEHKDLILAEITKGFKSWDNEATGVDINEELSQIANKALLGDEGVNGERIIRNASENVAVEILINPQTDNLSISLKKFLMMPVENRFLLFAGHVFKGSGDWVLQDGTFTFKKLAHVLNDTEVEAALKEQQATSLTLHCVAVGEWNSNISKQDASKVLTLNVNPAEKLDSFNGILQFTTYVSSFIKTSNLTDILPASDVIGNIGFNKPTLYIFPGCQGDSALFGIKGFNLLVNAGFNRKACFWDFTRHLDRIDAVLLTHLGTDNLFGISSVLKRKCIENAHPEIGYIYMNGVEKAKANGTENGNHKEPTLMINLAEEGSDIIEMSKQLGVTPQHCTRGEKVTQLEPVNLYHKVGHGSLDMYILNPVQDTKELKDFYQQWTKKVGQFGTHQGFPMPDMFSICALLVWKPTNPEEKITRVLFPGNAPQHKIIEGLEKVKGLDIFKHATCTGKDLLKPAGGAKKPTSASRTTAKPAAAKTAPPAKKETPAKVSPARSAPRASPPKTTKTETQKKTTTKTKDAGKEKSDKSKSSTSSSPSKGSLASSSPAKSATPAVTPVEPVAAPPVESVATNALNAVSEISSGLNGSLEPSPAPVENNTAPLDSSPVDAPQPTMDYNKQQLADLGIYDEDDDAGAVDGNLSTNAFPAQPDGSSIDSPDELIPQNLPDPVPIPVQSPNEPDLIQEMASDKVEDGVESNKLDESIASEPDLVPQNESQDYGDPADDIPSSPEPQFGDHDLPAIPPGRTAPLPSFTNEPDVVPSPESVQQNIQYGIGDDSSQRVMGGIKEEEEEDEDTAQMPEPNNDTSQTMEDLGIYEDDEGSQDGMDKSDPSAFVYEKDVDMEDEAQATRSAEEGGDLPPESDLQESSIPEAFERDNTPSLEESNQTMANGNGTGASNDDDVDSIDGNTPDTEKPIIDLGGKFEPEPAPASNFVNPLDSLQTGVMNSFQALDGLVDQVGETAENIKAEFDPLKEWGQPMGLPSPPPPSSASDKNAKPKTTAAKKTEAKKPAAAATKRPSSAKPASTSTSKTNGVDKKTDAKKPSLAADKKTATKSRPSTAPAKSETSKSGSSTTKTTAAARKPATSRTSPAPVKLPPLPALTPFYLDLTYVPNHGESNYCDVEFFKRIRARHYVLSALNPNPQVLDALLEAKQSWDNKDLEVMIIPTYDNETLRHWMGLNKEKLSQLKIDVAPSASRCFIQLQDHEANCSAYRLEF